MKALRDAPSAARLFTVIHQAVSALPAPQRPAFRDAGTLETAVRHPAAAAPGLYLIFFDSPGHGPCAYHGMASGSIAGRLAQHRACARRIGADPRSRRVMVAPIVDVKSIRPIERRINEALLRHAGTLCITNLTAELGRSATGFEPDTPLLEETHMHSMTCQCTRCRQGRLFDPFELAPRGNSSGSRIGESFGEELGAATSELPPTSEAPSYEDEALENELAYELLAVASEDELEEFLGKLVRGAWRGVQRGAANLARVARPLSSVLRGVAKTALPFVGGALGSFIPVPGVGTALGTALGSAVGSALESELSELEDDARELEMAKRYVRIARSAARQLSALPESRDPSQAAQRAVRDAARRHLAPHGGLPASSGVHQAGQWRRQGNRIVLLGV